MPQPVNLREARDLGELIQASFAFARQEFKPLFSLIALYAGPFILMYAIATAYYQGEIQLLTQNPSELARYGDSVSDILFANLKPLLAVLVLSVVSMVLVLNITTQYMKFYLKYGHGAFSKEEVWDSCREELGSYFGLTLGYMGIGVVGMLLFIIPGVYWYIAFSLMFMAHSIEGLGLGGSISRSQELVRGYWWNTFGFYLVFGIVISVLSGVLGLAQGVVQAVQVSTGFDQTLHYVYVGIGAVVAFVSYFLYVLVYIGQGLHYFNLVERKESPSLRDRINRIN